MLCHSIERVHVMSQMQCSTKTCGICTGKVCFNYSVAVERRTAKLLKYDNRLSVGTNILEG